MKFILAVLLILFASYADIFLFRVGVIPLQPSSFLIPLFLVICVVKYSILDFGDLFKTHSFKIFASILFFSLFYSAFTPVPMDLIIKKISLDAITILLYIFAVHFFRTEDKWLVFLVMFGAFVTLAGSVWYDYFVGLPKFSKSIEEMVRKGGFGENPNQASSGIKFLALGVLVFLYKFKTKKILFITAMVVSVFLTFSRSGIISVILILIFGTANSWDTKFKINPTSLFKSSFKMIIVFATLYVGLVMFAGIIKSEFPELARGAMGDRIDLLTGQGEGSVVSEDMGSGGGRGDLLFMYIDKFKQNPFGYGTAYTSDQRLVPLNTHNYYLFLAVNYGFLALILYLIYLWVGFRLSIKRDQFYYIIFLALLFFEGFVSHQIYYERAMLITLAFFDSLIYSKNTAPNESIPLNKSI